MPSSTRPPADPTAVRPVDAQTGERRDERGPWWGLGGLVSSRAGAWVVLLLGVLLSGAVFAAGSSSSSTAPDSRPADAESSRVEALLATFPDGDVAPAIAVYSRADGGELTGADLAAAAQSRSRMYTVDRGVAGAADEGAQAAPVVPSPDRKATLAIVPVSTDRTGGDLADVVADLRTQAATGLPAGLVVQVTGGPAFGADTNSALPGGEPRLAPLPADLRTQAATGLPAGLVVQVTGGPAFGADTAGAFAGADLRLLLVTAAVVAVLLLLTYRSPVLWLVPLLVVGLADRVAQILAGHVGDALGLSLDGSTTGITSVLVFGAGTNYALLLVSRYREELRRETDHRRALRRALRHTGPAVLASNVTVVLALATLLVAAIPSTRILGVAAATGLLVALAYAVLLLPAALAVCGRGLFWPFVPRAGDPDPAAGGGWYRLASGVARRPVLVLGITVPLLFVCALGLSGVRIGLEQTQQFRVAAQSVDGFETLRAHYPAGQVNPTTVLARTDSSAAVRSTITETPGVVGVRPTGSTADGLTRWQVVLGADPASQGAFDAVQALRDRLGAIPGAQALVGGSDAAQLDSRDAARGDLLRIVPLILGVVLLVLFALLRAVVGPLLLIAATTLSAVAAIGAGAWLSTHVFGFPGLETSVLLFSFLFLVALGVDYTIFLVTRASEEAAEHGTRTGIVRAVALTGGVITSAGVVLAAVFVVLGVLPLITLTQIGITVGIGILLDTFVVRTVVIPALFTLVGPRVWWPSTPAADR